MKYSLSFTDCVNGNASVRASLCIENVAISTVKLLLSGIINRFDNMYADFVLDGKGIIEERECKRAWLISAMEDAAQGEVLHPQDPESLKTAEGIIQSVGFSTGLGTDIRLGRVSIRLENVAVASMKGLLSDIIGKIDGMYADFVAKSDTYGADTGEIKEAVIKSLNELRLELHRTQKGQEATR